MLVVPLAKFTIIFATDNISDTGKTELATRSELAPFAGVRWCGVAPKSEASFAAQ